MPMMLAKLKNDFHRCFMIAFITLTVNCATSCAEIHFNARTRLMRRVGEMENANDPSIQYYKELLNYYHNEHLQTGEKRNVQSMFDSLYPSLTDDQIAVLPPIRFKKRENSMKYPTPLTVDNSITMIGKRLFIARIGKRSHIYTARIGRK